MPSGWEHLCPIVGPAGDFVGVEQWEGSIFFGAQQEGVSTFGWACEHWCPSEAHISWPLESQTAQINSGDGDRKLKAGKTTVTIHNAAKSFLTLMEIIPFLYVMTYLPPIR